MLTTLGAENRIWFCLRPTSLTRPFDGLSALVHNHLRSDPTNGDWYVFVNRRRTMMKILSFDRDGYWWTATIRTFGRVASLILLPNTGRCLIGMLPRDEEVRSEQQWHQRARTGRASERGSGALPGREQA